MFRAICLAVLFALSIVESAVSASAEGAPQKLALTATTPAPQTVFTQKPSLFNRAQNKVMCSSTVPCPQGFYCCPGFASTSLCCPNGSKCNYGKFRCE